MVEGFVPPAPEDVKEKKEEQVKAPEPRQELGAEAFKPPELQRVSDKTEQLKNPAQTYQSVFGELSSAKQAMLGVNDIISKGGGPYAQGDGLKAYQEALNKAQEHYTKARLAADSFLYVCDDKGNPVIDSTGHPIPSKENIAMRQQLAGIEQNLQKMAQDQSPEGRKKMQESIEQANQIKDLLRSSGFARANNAFALMFHSGDLKGNDRKAFAKTGVDLLTEAASFDPLMRRDPNYSKHYDAAMEVVLQGGGVNPDQAPKPGELEPPKPPKPGEVVEPPKPPKPGDVVEPPKTGEIPGAPSAKLSQDGNKFFVEYQKPNAKGEMETLRVPTWMQKNPDGTESKPFTMTIDVKQPDGSTKQQEFSRADGMLRPVVETKEGPNKGKVLGVDGNPLMDANGMRRIGADGKPVRAQFDASDPVFMQAQLEAAIKGPLDDKSRAAYNKLIESADKIDRVSIVRNLDAIDAFIKKNPEAFQWENTYRQLTKQLGGPDVQKRPGEPPSLFDELTTERAKLNDKQLEALRKMWPERHSMPVDQWLEKPENKDHKAALTANPEQWAQLKSKYQAYLNKEAEVKAKEDELRQKPQLLESVKQVRAADAISQEMFQLLVSSNEARGSYLTKLLSQEGVDKYLKVQDKNSDAAKALEADKETKANLDEARRVIVELAKSNDKLAARLGQTAAALNIDLAKVLAKPAEPKPEPVVKPDPVVRPDPVVKPEPPKEEVKPNPGPGVETGGLKPAPKPGEQTAEVKDPPKTDEVKPGEVKKDPAAEPARTNFTEQEVAASPQVLQAAFNQYLQGSKGGTEAMKAEDFAKLLPAWERALEANATITADQIKALDEQTKQTFASGVLLKMLSDKFPGKSFDELVKLQDQIPKEELQKALSEAASKWESVDTPYKKLLAGLKQEDAAKFKDAEKSFFETMAVLEQGTDKSKLPALQLGAYKAKVEAQKAISPELAKAIEEREAALADDKVKHAKRFAESLEWVESLKQVDLNRVYLAQALTLQGNKDKAKTLLEQAIKNPNAAALLENTQEGKKLLQDYNLKTDSMKKTEEEENRLFPEMKLRRSALAALEDKSKDVNAAFSEADSLFKQAIETIDKEMMAKGQGKDLAESVKKVGAIVDSMKLQLGMALEDFKADRRKLPGPEGAEKESDTKLVREAMVNMTQDDMIQALVGKKGQQMQAYMLRVLTDAERTTLQNMQILALKAQAVSSLRLEQAIKTSEHAFKTNDESLKVKAKDMVEAIAMVDPVTFTESPEILGALRQAQQKRQIDIKEGKAGAVAFTEAAKDTVAKSQSGLVDYLLPGSSLVLNTAGVNLTGHYVSEIPVVGGFFGGSKQATEQIIDQLAAAQFSNEMEAKAQRDQVVGDANKGLRGLAGDVSGVGVSFLSGWGTSKGLQYLAKETPLPWYVKAPVVAGVALTAGGLTNNAVSGNDLLASRGFIRNTVATGTTYAAIKAWNYMPANRSLNPELLAKTGYEGTQLTGAQLGKALAADSGKKGLVAIAEALPSRINPVNYTPFRIGALADGAKWYNPLSQMGRFQFAGWGGNKTAELLANGTMTLAEYNTRQFAARTLGLGALGYGHGVLNTGAQLYTGDHFGGKKYTTFSDYWTDMHNAGVQNAIVAGFVVPVVGKAFVPNSWQTGTKNLVTNGFSRLPGVDAAAATKALGTASLMYFRPTTDASQKWGEASILDHYYQEAAKKVAERKQQVKDNLEGKKPEEAKKPEEQKK